MASTNKEYYDKNFPNDNGFALNKDFIIGPFFEEAIKNAGINDKYSMEKQVATAMEIFSCCNPQYEVSNVKRTGNVTGKVQSGKTTSFALTAALAADNGYQLIINTLGTKNNLVEDNLRAVKKILGIYEGSGSSWRVFPIAAENKGGAGIDKDNLAAWLKQPPHSRNIRRVPVYIPLIKITSAINKLINLIKGLNLATEDIKVLIIDDEVDSYGMNTTKLESKNNLSPTNKALGELLDVCGIATYLGYSATSSAVQLSHAENFMSPDFHVLLHPGKGYIGNRELFGNPPQILDEEAYKNFKPRPQIKILENYEEVILDKNGNEKIVDNKNALESSLYDAICDFLVTTQIYNDRFMDNQDVKSMMIHPSSKTGDKGVKEHELNHEECMYILDDFLKGGQLFADLDSGDLSNINYKRINQAYIHHKKHHTQHQDKFPSLDSVIHHIKNLVDPVKQDEWGVLFSIKACNGKNPPDIDWDSSPDKIWFLVGGLNLSRGFVVRGLLTTWMPVEAQKIIADTMEQRGRFFGYKENYLDLIRIYVKPKTHRAFLQYIPMEEDQWGTFEETRKLGIPLSESDVFHTQLDSIAAMTAKNKTKRPIQKIKYKWTAAKTLPFDTLQKVPSKNKFMEILITNYLTSISLKQIPKNNKFNASSKGQKFMFGSYALEDVYNGLLQFIHDLCVKNGEDALLQNSIKHIKNNLVPNPNSKCDIIYFNGDDLNRKIIFDEIDGVWCWPNYGYTSGAAKPLRLCDPQKDFCGDDQVILGNNFNPYTLPFDKDLNFNTTVQIHKLNVHSGDGIHKLKDVYGIRIRLPH